MGACMFVHYSSYCRFGWLRFMYMNISCLTNARDNGSFIFSMGCFRHILLRLNLHCCVCVCVCVCVCERERERERERVTSVCMCACLCVHCVCVCAPLCVCVCVCVCVRFSQPWEAMSCSDKAGMYGIVFCLFMGNGVCRERLTDLNV